MIASAIIFLFFSFYFSFSSRPQRFWAVVCPATSRNFPIYLTRAHSDLCRKTFADALVCMGISVSNSLRHNFECFDLSQFMTSPFENIESQLKIIFYIIFRLNLTRSLLPSECVRGSLCLLTKKSKSVVSSIRAR